MSGKIISASQGMTLEGMMSDEDAQTLKLQSSIDAVNRRLLQTYQMEQELRHSLQNLYNMVELTHQNLEYLKCQFNALVEILHVDKGMLDKIASEQVGEHHISAKVKEESAQNESEECETEENANKHWWANFVNGSKIEFNSIEEEQSKGEESVI